MTREQLRAARALLNLRQDQLATIAGLGIATVRRFEGGADIGLTSLATLRRAIEGAGAILLEPDVGVDGRGRGADVALAPPERPSEAMDAPARPPSGDD